MAALDGQSTVTTSKQPVHDGMLPQCSRDRRNSGMARGLVAGLEDQRTALVIPSVQQARRGVEQARERRRKSPCSTARSASWSSGKTTGAVFTSRAARATP
jgi:hypothetical protein